MVWQDFTGVSLDTRGQHPGHATPRAESSSGRLWVAAAAHSPAYLCGAFNRPLQYQRWHLVTHCPCPTGTRDVPTLLVLPELYSHAADPMAELPACSSSPAEGGKG